MVETKNLGCRAIEVIEIRSMSGKGTPEEPYRSFREYWSKEGERLAVIEDIDRQHIYEKTEVLSWDKGEPMSEEYAISLIGSIKRFVRARYYHPTLQAFNGYIDYKAWMEELIGLEEYIRKCERG